MQLGGFSAWIEVEGVEANEYNIEPSADGKRITCWIASEAEKHFAVRWRNSTVAVDTIGRVSLDGRRAGARILACNQRTKASLGGFNTTSTTSKPFIFSSLELTDDDSYLDSASAQHVGEIELFIWRVTASKKRRVLTRRVSPDEPSEKVHERSKKAISHKVKFGEEIQLKSPKYHRNVIKLDKEPILTFLFKYRSLEFLRAMGIAPSPVPEKRKASVSPEREIKTEVGDDDCQHDEDPDFKELKLLQELVRVAEARLAKKTNKNKKIKKETQPVFAAGEVIDLT